MDIALAILISAAWLFVPLGIALPKLRLLALLVLLVAAAAAVAAAVAGPAERSLELVHTFAGYEGSELEPSAVDFVVDHRKAPGWQWGAVFAAWALPWALLLLWRRRRPDAHPLLLPLLAAWSATACWLLLQVTAAPDQVVQPFALERLLFPAGVALTILAAARAQALVPMLAQLSLGVLLMRLPVAVFSKLASDRALGTSLDVHTITEFVNPLTQQQVVTTANSGEQHLLLIWAQQLIVFPGLYMLSFTGIGIALYLYHKHGPRRPQRPA